MKLHVFLVSLAAAVLAMTNDAAARRTTPNPIRVAMGDAGDVVSKRLTSMERMLAAVSNQLMMTQYMLEERTRASGKTGIKAVRIRQIGTKPYHLDSYSSFGTASIHDHSNNIRTVGMGEFTAVLNGIEFKTRHNDYRLYMPHPTNSSYGMVADVPFPPVPPSVTSKGGVKAQIAEMQEYFRAWRDQNKTHRDYTNYFKPVLCYLEGAWTKSGEKIDEPFFSDRHFVDAKNWMELQKKARFVSYSGSKSRLENLANLPTAIVNMINDTIPEFAQFNYRILCHPLQQEVPLDRFQVVDDLHLRVNRKRSAYQHRRSRGARFALGPSDKKFEDGKFNRGFLDDLMAEIPGMNNYPGHFEDEGLDVPALEWDGKTKKDVSRYHRVYKIGVRDATGVSVVNRGFNDDFMFAAMTDQPKVAAMSVRQGWRKINGKWQRPTLSQRWTWAFPLEIIFLTPLQRWNPYNIEYKGNSRSDEGKTVTANGRNGQCTSGKEYDGANSQAYFLTPAEFFGRSHTSSSADTVWGSRCMLDRSRTQRKVQASGIRSFLPKIADLGAIRIRYPIFPVHDEGSTVWKELAALKELVMDKENYGKYYWKPSNEEETGDMQFELPGAKKGDTPGHTHRFTLTASQIRSLTHFGERVTVTTEFAASHTHDITLHYIRDKKLIQAYMCDGKWWRCENDGHETFHTRRLNSTDV